LEGNEIPSRWLSAIFLTVLDMQILGFGWAGIFRKYLVDPAAMWWPANLVQVSLFRHGFSFHY